MDLLFPARWLSPIRHRLCALEGLEPQQTILAGYRARGDYPQCRPDRSRGLVGVIFFIAGEALLPRVTLDSTRLSPVWPYVGAPVALLSIAAMVVLWVGDTQCSIFG